MMGAPKQKHTKYIRDGEIVGDINGCDSFTYFFNLFIYFIKKHFFIMAINQYYLLF